MLRSYKISKHSCFLNWFVVPMHKTTIFLHSLVTRLKGSERNQLSPINPVYCKMSNSLENAFKGKKVMVTGAGRGIGKAVVKRLHSYEAQIYALSIDAKELDSLKKEFPGINTIVCDISKLEETEQALKDLEAMDYLLNNAALLSVAPVLNITSQQFDDVFNVNVKGTMKVSQIIAQKMIESGKGGSITFISSIAAGNPGPGAALYSMSKSAVEMFSKALALELGPQKIRVNVVRPACVETEMLTEFRSRAGMEKDAHVAAVEARTPYAHPSVHMQMDHLVNLILFTLSDMCPQMTGTTTVMDGGFHMS